MNHRGFYMHNRARYFVQQGLPSESAGLEMSYLPFDGVNDYAHAIDGALGAAAAGTAGEYCLVLKLNSANYNNIRRAACIIDTTGSPSSAEFGPLAALIYKESVANRQELADLNRAGTITGSRAYTFPSGGPCVVAHAYRNSPLASAGFWAQGGVSLNNAALSAAPTVVRVPEHVAIGNSLRVDLTPAASYASIQFIACVVLNRFPTTAEMATYSATGSRDARNVWGPAIHAYWAASDAAGAAIPARVGSVPLTIVGGLTSSSLVSI